MVERPNIPNNNVYLHYYFTITVSNVIGERYDSTKCTNYKQEWVHTS